MLTLHWFDLLWFCCTTQVRNKSHLRTLSINNTEQQILSPAAFSAAYLRYVFNHSESVFARLYCKSKRRHFRNVALTMQENLTIANTGSLYGSQIRHLSEHGPPCSLRCHICEPYTDLSVPNLYTFR